MRDKHDFRRIFEQAMEDAFPSDQRGDSEFADSADTAAMLHMEEEEFDQMCQFMVEVVQSMINTAIHRGHMDDEDMNLIMNSAVANAMVCTLILKMGMDSTKKDAPPVQDRYPTTLMAEAHIRNHILDGADLNNIWPLPLAEEVVSEFDPLHAFMVGVVCGSQRG